MTSWEGLELGHRDLSESTVGLSSVSLPLGLWDQGEGLGQVQRPRQGPGWG